MPISLKALHHAHTGKVSDKWDSYLDFYDQIFSPYREKNVRILEIGIQNGGSLEVWGKYFPNAECIVGCDIAKATKNLTFWDSRISVAVGDANSAATIDKIRAMTDGFDLIIDDGSHCSGDIIKSFSIYFPMLRENGLYIVEDLGSGFITNR